MKTLKKILILIWKKIKKEKEISFFILFLFLAYFLIINFSDRYLVEIPKEGGEIHEIVIGEKPRFINPVSGRTKIDKSLISLIYSPLFIKDKNGNLKDNIASYKIDETKKVYKIKLKKGILFHDGVELTSQDVSFTIQQIQNPNNKSFYASNWVNVKVKILDKYNLEIIIPKVNYYFKDSLILYILPKHIWENIDYFDLNNENLNPTGSGKFKIDSIVWKNIKLNNKQEKKIQSIILKKNEKYFGEKIWINKIIFDFFENKNNFIQSSLYKENSKNIDIFSSDKYDWLKSNFLTNSIKENIDFNLTIKNHNSNKFLNNKIIRKYIFDIWNSNEKELENIKTNILKNKDFSFDKKNNLLKYKNNFVTFSIISGKNQDLSLLNLSNSLKEKLKKAGIIVHLKIIDDKAFSEIINSRKFESIITGYKNNEKYLFYYYHSSQKNFPWINIAQYNSLKIDTLLEKLIVENNLEKRKELKEKLLKEISSYYLTLKLENLKSYYYTSKKIDNLNLNNINSGLDRFFNIENWIILKEKILPFFKD